VARYGDRVADEPDHWFEPIADHLGAAYLRYSFTKGTVAEVDALVTLLSLGAATRVLDVGCGPGRHAHELARRGVPVHGVDISARFVELAVAGAPPGATFARMDARRLNFDSEFDAVISICEGAFGLLTGDGENEAALSGMYRALRPGGRLALTAFNAYYAVRYHTDATFDAVTGISHERTEIRDETGHPVLTDLWTTCFTPRELRWLFERAGFVVDELWAVEPGDYRPTPPDSEHPEFLVVATRP
jgi:SAM-dependent methyltransferase